MIAKALSYHSHSLWLEANKLEINAACYGERSPRTAFFFPSIKMHVIKESITLMAEHKLRSGILYLQYYLFIRSK